MIIRSVLIGAVCACAALPTAAQAGPLQLVHSGAVAMNDGKRYVAWVVKVDWNVYSARVFDARTSTMSTVPSPRPYCEPWTLGSGQLLWRCAKVAVSHSKMPDLFVQDLATRSVRKPPGQEDIHLSFPKADELVPAEVGAHWILGYAVNPAIRYSEPFLFNWHTGAVRRPSRRTDTVLDLNVPGAHARLCPPLRRREINFSYRYRYARPFGMSLASSGALMLDRCGSARRTTIARMPLIGYTTPTLSAGIVTWGETGPPGPGGSRGEVFAYDARTGRRTRWVHPDPDTGGLPVVDHIGRLLIVTDLPLGDTPRRTYFAVIPA
ncbi:MAG: hypothetical protein QOJ97_1885 [Solirubrobacteraceae bacterium]|jgi:hypothetical protein|nr:hypothetical protein [Solirubrobacteraceae bacterium]